MNDQIKYQDWPKIVKVTTALSNNKILLKSPTIPYVLGYFLFIGGILGLVYAFFKSESFIATSNISNITYILIGLANVISGNSIKWIASNSSWEERFKNKSSLSNKIIYILISLLLVACLVGMIVL